MWLVYIGQQLTIYIGLLILIGGLIGNGINIFVFSSVRSYRITPCTFYFLIASICNVIYIMISLTFRVMSAGFGSDLGVTSISWCKTRYFCIFTLSLITLTCSCLATIDQYFATSQSASLRRLSNIKWAHRIVLITITIGCCHGIPIILFYNLSPVTNICGNNNVDYAVYISIYILGFICAAPSLLMTMFGCLAYRNIRRTRVLVERQADRQLTRMMLIQVMLVVICIVPYGINNAYSLITFGISKSPDRILNENFASSTFNLLSYFYYAGSCYMFYISSHRFRRAVRNRLLCKQLENQIIPIQQGTHGGTILAKRARNGEGSS